MPRVPSYDGLQVGLNSLPQARFQAGEVRDTAGPQAQAIGNTLSGVGQQLSKEALLVQDQVNQARVSEALNQVKDESMRLTHDKDVGFMMLKGKAALERPDKQSLEEEYGSNLSKTIQSLSATLNSAQRAQFDAHAGGILVSLRQHAMQHRNKELVGYQVSQAEGTVATAAREIALNPGDDKTMASAMTRIRAGIEQQASLTGQAPEWTEAAVRSASSKAIRGAVSQMIDKDPHAARAYLDKHQDKMDWGDVLQVRDTIEGAAVRADGVQAGEAIYRNSGPVGSDFESIFRHVLKVEGGYVANDAGKGETNLGINKTANPDLNIKGMTVDKARDVYRQRYWNAIGGDKLPPQVRAIAFDAAVNHGPSFANKIVAEADGDPAKMVALRREEYARLVRSNPAKFQQYAKSWENRLRGLEAGSSGRRSVSDMLAQADRIEDPKRRAIAQQTIRDSAQRDEFAQKEAYGQALSQAQDVAYQAVGGWRNVPADVWGKLSREDQAKLVQGPAKASDPDTLLKLNSNPQLWKAGAIEQYRPLLTEADYRSYYDKGNGPDAANKVLAATIDQQQFKDVLNQTGMYKILVSKEDADKQTIIDLQGKFEREMNSEQKRLGRQLNMEEKNTMLRQLIKPVMVSMTRTGSLFGLFDGPAGTEERRAFQVQNPQNIVIPKEVRQRITEDMKRAGIVPTEKTILQAYLRMK